MIIGKDNYVYACGRGCSRASSKKSKVWIVRNSSSATGVVEIRGIRFPKNCIGKRVRLKVEFVDEPNVVLDRNNNAVEMFKWDGE